MIPEKVQKPLKAELSKLYGEGIEILQDEIADHEDAEKESEEQKLPLQFTYQRWYSRALPVIRQVLPDRQAEFVELYKLERPRKKIDHLTYTISDYLLGLKVSRGHEEVVDSYVAFVTKFQSQLMILNSAIDRIESTIADIEGLLASALFDSELAAAEELKKKGHVRAAGALAGVTLEAHLAKVCENHGVKFRKKAPAISDYNDGLKSRGTVDVPTWRLIQRLGDIRNLAVHKKEREPTADEIEDLIRGTRKLVAEVY